MHAIRRDHESDFTEARQFALQEVIQLDGRVKKKRAHGETRNRHAGTDFNPGKALLMLNAPKLRRHLANYRRSGHRVRPQLLCAIRLTCRSWHPRSEFRARQRSWSVPAVSRGRSWRA